MEYFSSIKRKNSICIIIVLERKDEEQIVGCQGEGGKGVRLNERVTEGILW